MLKQKYTGIKPGASLYNPATREAEAGASHNKHNSYLDYRVNSSAISLGNLSEDFSQNKEDQDIYLRGGPLPTADFQSEGTSQP